MRFAAFVLLSLASFPMPTLAESGALPEIPTPAGPYGIGRIGYHWTDRSRPAPRELMVYLWYPTSAKSATTRGAYLPGAKQFDAAPATQTQMRKAFGTRWPAILSGAIYSHAEESARPAKSPRRFPVVIFSHGNGSSGFHYTTLIEDLTSHGYAVASIEHTGVSMMVLFPDGGIVPFERTPPPIADGIGEGAADVRFALDQLTKCNAGPAREFLLAGRLEMNRAAAMGHSAGAEFAARACQLDARLKACVDLDGGMVPIAALPEYPDGATMRQPLLFLEADHPTLPVSPARAEAYYRKKEEQLQRCRPGSYNVILKSDGIAHPSFSDTPLLFSGEQGYPVTNVVRHNLELIETFVRAFLDKVLRGTKSALLDGGQTQLPEATLRRYGR